MGIPSTLVPVPTAKAPWCAWIHVAVRARVRLFGGLLFLAFSLGTKNPEGTVKANALGLPLL